MTQAMHALGSSWWWANQKGAMGRRCVAALDNAHARMQSICCAAGSGASPAADREPAVMAMTLGLNVMAELGLAVATCKHVVSGGSFALLASPDRASTARARASTTDESPAHPQASPVLPDSGTRIGYHGIGKARTNLPPLRTHHKLTSKVSVTVAVLPNASTMLSRTVHVISLPTLTWGGGADQHAGAPAGKCQC